LYTSIVWPGRTLRRRWTVIGSAGFFGAMIDLLLGASRRSD
jgi:hypothetical protein